LKKPQEPEEKAGTAETKENIHFLLFSSCGFFIFLRFLHFPAVSAFSLDR